jgi:hypothetical protein
MGGDMTKKEYANLKVGDKVKVLGKTKDGPCVYRCLGGPGIYGGLCDDCGIFKTGKAVVLHIGTGYYYKDNDYRIVLKMLLDGSTCAFSPDELELENIEREWVEI